MRRSALAAALACLVLAGGAAAGASGCEAILGMDGHQAHLASTTTTSDAGAGAGVDAGEPPCVFPFTGDATLRVGNFIPATARVDACLARSGKASPIDGEPVVASARGACPSGVGYKDITIPFDVESGTYDVKLVPAGSPCTAPALAGAQVTLAAGKGAGVYLLGASTSVAQALVLNEEVPLGEASAIRFANAVAGSGPFDFGVVSPNDAGAPQLKSTFFGNVAFGALGTSSSDDNGYTVVTILGGAVPFGAAPTGAASLSLVADPTLAVADGYTAFAIGTPNDPSFPEELYVCNERMTDGPLTQCANGPSFVTVDVFDPFIWGPFAPFESLRQGAIGPALAKLSSDVLCIPDVFGDSVTAEVAKEANYPYVIHFADSLTTPIDDPALEDGGLPPPPVGPPCANYDGDLQPFLDCLDQYCTVPLSDPDASIMENAGACITNNCAGQAEVLLFGKPAELACWNCAFFNVQGGASMADTRSACETDVNAGYAFSGQSGVSIFSRLKPFAPAEQWVLPSTSWRSNIVRAPLTLPSGGEFDAYCALLDDPSSSITIPYTGNYGNGAIDVNGWNAELALQTSKLVAYVRRKSGSLPAVVMGEFYSGPGADDGTPTFDSFAYSTLSAAFPLAATASGPSGCTLCAANPILTPPGEMPASTNALTTFPLLTNIPVTDVVSTAIELTEPVLDAGTIDASTLEDGGAPGNTEAGVNYSIPLSTYYDYRAVIQVRP